eukprot:2811581-Rhodomonas_salina.1
MAWKSLAPRAPVPKTAAASCAPVEKGVQSTAACPKPTHGPVVPAGGTYFCDGGFPFGWCCGANALAMPSAVHAVAYHVVGLRQCDPKLLAKEAFNHFSVLVEKIASVLIRTVVSPVGSLRARVACTLEAALARSSWSRIGFGVLARLGRAIVALLGRACEHLRLVNELC